MRAGGNYNGTHISVRGATSVHKHKIKTKSNIKVVYAKLNAQHAHGTMTDSVRETGSDLLSSPNQLLLEKSLGCDSVVEENSSEVWSIAVLIWYVLTADHALGLLDLLAFEDLNRLNNASSAWPGGTTSGTVYWKNKKKSYYSHLFKILRTYLS